MLNFSCLIFYAMSLYCSLTSSFLVIVPFLSSVRILVYYILPLNWCLWSLAGPTFLCYLLVSPTLVLVSHCFVVIECVNKSLIFVCVCLKPRVLASPCCLAVILLIIVCVYLQWSMLALTSFFWQRVISHCIFHLCLPRDSQFACVPSQHIDLMIIITRIHVLLHAHVMCFSPSLVYYHVCRETN